MIPIYSLSCIVYNGVHVCERRLAGVWTIAATNFTAEFYRNALIFVAAAGPRASFLMATFLAGTKLVNKKGELSVLDPAVPTYLYFGAVW